MPRKTWDGRSITVLHQTELEIEKPVAIQLTREAAHRLALSIRALGNTTLMVSPDIRELMQALDYVLVGDPASVRRHTEMQSSKGMDPSSATAPDGKWNASTDPRLRALRVNPPSVSGHPLGTRNLREE